MENKLIFCSTRSFKSPMFYYSKAFILPDFAKQGVFTNAREIPQITEISLHMSLKDSALSPTKLGLGFFILGHLTNQKPTPTFAKKAIATFKLQKKVALGVQTTLRKKNYILSWIVSSFIFSPIRKILTVSTIRKVQIKTFFHLEFLMFLFSTKSKLIIINSFHVLRINEMD